MVEDAGRRLIVHAPNVHFGGGAVLLKSILQAKNVDERMELLCDTRMAIDAQNDHTIALHRFRPTLAGRFGAERKLREIATPHDIVLAFGNLPPIFRLPCETVLFLQHPYLVDSSMPLAGFNRSAQIRIAVERCWIRARIGNVDRVIVQTASMAHRFRNEFHRPAEIAPFRPNPNLEREHGAPGLAQLKYDFIYVASGEPHKNHLKLLEAWVCLAEQGTMPTLALTLSPERDAELVALVENLTNRHGLKIVNLGRLTSSGVAQAYAHSERLIFPSLGESFGLPLIEATEMGLPIVASELDYVRDLVRPSETFDPRSARSIARAVRRALSLPDDVLPPIETRAFLNLVVSEPA